MIHAHFVGRLARDAELKHIPSGDPVLSFSVANDRGYGEKKQTTWVNCSLFGKRGEKLVSHLTKGAQVCVHGEIYTREWKTQDGATKTALECRVSEIDLVGGKPNQQGGEVRGDSRQASYDAQAPSSPEKFDDDIPF
jgi:single-strand DNA-binding protein